MRHALYVSPCIRPDQYPSQLVAADEAVANKKFADAQSIKDDCEKELAKAVPALNAATDALNTLKQDDIRVVKAMKNPPSGVKLVSSS